MLYRSALDSLRYFPFLTLLAVAACSDAPAVDKASRPAPRPEIPSQDDTDAAGQAKLRKERAERNRAANAAAVAASNSASPVTAAHRDFYARAEAALLSDGRLRPERIPQDAPIDAEGLTQDFIEIALHDEYYRDGDKMVAGGAAAPVRRWQDPVRFQLEYGASTDVATRRAVRVEVSEYAGQLSRVTRHPMNVVDVNGNFVVLMLNDDERRSIGPRLQQLVPGIPADDIALIRDLDRNNYCTVFAYSRGNSSVYAKAVALVRAELPPMLRKSCFHEELAQGLGLSNDSPTVRPSIFNDDEEFALLTRHDELLLQILYDRRLRPGMTEAEARPIVLQIARELLGTAI
ncbi:DUF2927 domain-containing protein [Paracoccus sp. 11-3]|uniref:DUF2927 domain-containing protein n=1 Tax=Paracoccus amoyensis TaxID=2760093 RepID=A0A926GE93_9RHOB|nr:DUF2927 domain-containing protein [Paracoccus amoyensis]